VAESWAGDTSITATSVSSLSLPQDRTLNKQTKIESIVIGFMLLFD